MKYIRSILMVIALVCLLQVASAAPKIYIEPSDSLVANGSTFMVDVKVGPLGSEVTTAMYTLRFDNTHLRAISQTQGGFLSQGGEATKVDPNAGINNTAGTVSYGEYIEAEPDETHFGVYSPGTLTSITFEAIGDGAGKLDITNPKLAVVIGRPDTIFVTYLFASDINIFNASYTVSQYPRGDLDHNWVAADAVDVAMMIQASVGDIIPNSEYDLDNNGNDADAVDVAMMIQASVGDIPL